MDDEIVVGVNLKKQNTQAKGKKNAKSNNKNKTKGNSKNPNAKNKKVKMRKNAKIILYVILFAVIFALIINSPLFNVKNIEVEGNETVSDDKIISLSGLQLYNNIFRFNKLEIIENVKQNAYIEDADISRKLPSTVIINVIERAPKYMLQFADSYVYINNQGYMLEISNEKLDIPILIGFTTDLSNIKAGNRINVEDLKKMDMVIKIYEAAKSNDLGHLVTKIDISDEKNYTIILESEGKKVYLGDCSDLNTRILYLKAILEKSPGKKGEVFLNVDLNSQNVYFRPSSD